MNKLEQDNFLNTIYKILNLYNLKSNWDSCGAKEISNESMNSAVHFLSSILTSDTPVPSVVPIPNGGLQVEWHKNGIDLEIEFKPNRYIFAYADGNYSHDIKSKTWEIKTETDLNRLRHIITEITYCNV